MPDSLREVHVVLDLPHTPEIVVLSLDNEPMGDLMDHLEEEDNL